MPHANPHTPDVATATGEEIESLVAGNAAFAFDLYRALSAGDGNLFLDQFLCISPFPLDGGKLG